MIHTEKSSVMKCLPSGAARMIAFMYYLLSEPEKARGHLVGIWKQHTLNMVYNSHC